jgi:uncharacterized surface anchored protein
MKTMRNVTIGDKFKNGKHIICEVVDFYEIRSVKTGQIVDYQCIAKGINTFSTNSFEIAFATVGRNRI